MNEKILKASENFPAIAQLPKDEAAQILSEAEKALNEIQSSASKFDARVLRILVDVIEEISFRFNSYR